VAGPTFTNPEALGQHLEKVVAGVAVDIGRAVTVNVAEATPVDTTHARSNWIPSVGSPQVGVAGTKESPSSVEQSVGLAQLASYRLEQGDVFVANNVDYIDQLNQGSSPQAPPEFVETAIEEALANVFIKG
jgi:hypothetical protein